ncbi:MAG: 5,6-dimethylbenzimidazole synthase [Rhodospirillaceae bacterium]|jgi:5,6-dimethylbenzimidazole synthase|nr:5,6-dimethylbenzimidazole synthase [Rhodospirillaceae bacterium]|tara:strand:- start:3894 stop:4535 length:642 start_codon:yes stop_codon:yes gene_type:complete
MLQPPEFDDSFRGRLHDLLVWRRDVRHFRTDTLPPSTVEDLIAEAALSPSVGHSQPWRFVTVDDPSRRAAVREDFLACNREALDDYEGERAKLYASLKLAGLDDAPVQMAVFVDNTTQSGHGVGCKTMPEALPYSVVMAVHTLWLAGRARSVGLGWVSILNPKKIEAILDVPESWSLVAYLCIGYPREEHNVPELERHGWQDRDPQASALLKR